LAGINRGKLAAAAGMDLQAIVRMEKSGQASVVSRNGTLAKVLAGLGKYKYNVLLSQAAR
jgi:hypothetical protein